MKWVILAILVAVAFGRTLDDDLRMFQDFKQTYGRSYSPSEDVHKFNCFRRVLNLIDERNAKGGEQHGVNQFSDMCPEEFKETLLGLKIPANHTRNPIKVTSPQASNVDWRTKGAVTPIKNQGMCGSCWTFSATGNMEGQWKLAGHTLVGLSEEELVQCVHNVHGCCFGCRGGLMDYAFDWVVQNGGIDAESRYPYTSGGGVTGQCNNALLSDSVAKISGHHDLPQNEHDMANYCGEHGPLSIGVDALTWQTYSGGIMTNCPQGQLDHGVLIVGFDLSFSTPYWIVKNSWGTSWGENGYIRLQFGTDQCGLTQACSSSIVN